MPSGTLIVLSFDSEHPSAPVTFRFLGVSPAIQEQVAGIYGVSQNKITKIFTCSLTQMRQLVTRFDWATQFMGVTAKTIKDYESRADIEVSYASHTKRVVVRFNPRVFHGYPTKSDFESYQLLDGGRSFTIAAMEAFKLQDYHARNYAHLSIRFDTEASEIIAKELSRRVDMEKYSKAESDDSIISPLNYPPRPYHTSGARFALECFDRGYGPIIALDMGLGKTYLAVLVSRLLAERSNNPNFKTLWITKASLSLNLEMEIMKLSGEQAMRLQGITPTQNQAMAMLQNKYKHFIISYEIVGRWQSDKEDEAEATHIQPWVALLNMMGFNACVMDEAHNIKNIETQRSIAARSIKIPNRMQLTGTPIVNKPMELYPLLHVAMPDRYNSPQRFHDVHAVAGSRAAKNPQKLKDELLPIMFRRAKSEVEKDLPPVIHMDHLIEGDKIAWERYKAALKDVFIDYKGRQTDINSILAKLTRCKQITADAKVPFTVELAQECYEETEKKVLIFSKFKASMHHIAQELNCHYIDGDIDEHERMDYVKDFQSNPATKYLVLSTAIGSEGLNLTAAHTVIFNDLPWTPKDVDQAIARAWGRLSDMHGCNVYYVKWMQAIDSFVWGLITLKRQLTEEITDGVRTHTSTESVGVYDLLERLRANTY